MRRTLTIVAVNVAVFCALAELLGLAVYYVEYGTLFYTDSTHYKPVADASEQRLTGEALHPYFGPTHNEGAPFELPPTLREPGRAAAAARTNNFGFVSGFNYPYTPASDRQFVIGLIGGSVGLWFCEVGAQRLLEDLRRNAFFRDRELVPMCLSHEGYKQPQELLVLTYFLSIGQHFDLVINIDGFNDVALGTLNDQRGLDISMPSAQHLEPLINLIDQSTLTPDKLHALEAISRDKDRLNALLERMRGNRSAAVNLVLERLYTRTFNDYIDQSGRFANLPSNPAARTLIRATPRVHPRDGDRVFEDIAAGWAESSVLMHDLLAARGVPFFHVLQPNQYFTTRRFGAAEAAVALNKDSPYKAGVEKGYPALVRAANARLTSKVPFFDGTHIFDDEREAVYLDNCCHYTLAGNRRLADFIARSILGSAGPWQHAG